MSTIHSYFTINYHYLDVSAIGLLNEQVNDSLEAIISGVEDHHFGCLIQKKQTYFLFYLENKNELSGLGIELSLKLDVETRTNYTLEFCKLIQISYRDMNFIDAFNIFQRLLCTKYEKIGYTVLNSEINDFLSLGNFTRPAVEKTIVFPSINKLELYRWFFNENEKKATIDQTSKNTLCLLLDPVTHFIRICVNEKICKKQFADYLITAWIAPISELNRVHHLFWSKRRNDDWFELDFFDLKKLKSSLSSY